MTRTLAIGVSDTVNSTAWSCSSSSQTGDSCGREARVIAAWCDTPLTALDLVVAGQPVFLAGNLPSSFYAPLSVPLGQLGEEVFVRGGGTIGAGNTTANLTLLLEYSG